MRRLWAEVVRAVVLDEWAELRRWRLRLKHPRTYEARLQRTRKYFESRSFQQICDFCGLDHSPALVEGLMKLVTGPKRPKFYEAQTPKADGGEE